MASDDWSAIEKTLIDVSGWSVDVEILFSFPFCDHEAFHDNWVWGTYTGAQTRKRKKQRVCKAECCDCGCRKVSSSVLLSGAFMRCFLAFTEGLFWALKTFACSKDREDIFSFLLSLASIASRHLCRYFERQTFRWFCCLYPNACSSCFLKILK